MLDIKKILLPTDFSDFSRIALPYAIDLAVKFDADIYIMHVFDENSLNPYYFAKQDEPDTWFLKIQENFQSMVDDFLEDIDTGEINIIPVLSNGTPFVEVTGYAKREKIDLIVLSSHGHGGAMQSTIGGTTGHIVSRAACPVLTVRTPESLGKQAL